MKLRAESTSLQNSKKEFAIITFTILQQTELIHPNLLD